MRTTVFSKGKSDKSMNNRTISPWRRFNAMDGLIHLLVGFMALICILPIINMVAISFSANSPVAAGMVFFWPVNFTMASYDRLLGETEFVRAFNIAVLRAITGTGLSMVVTILFAYPMSKETKHFRQRTPFMWLAVITMFFGGGLIPSFINIRNFGLLDNYLVYIVPGAFGVFNAVLLMNFFRGVPKELEEAASMDGASPLGTLLRIYLPISLPALATITLFNAVGHWNDFFTGLIYVTDASMHPLSTYIYRLNLTVDDIRRITDPVELARRLEVSSQTFNAAKIVVSMIPVLCIYPFLQRYFVKGLVIGSVKG